MDYTYEYEPIREETNEEDYNVINLDDLDENEKKIIDPLVPPTSGLRMVIFDTQDAKYTMTRKQTLYFLRVIKGISVVAKEELQNEKPNVLIVTDDRPSADALLDLSSRIFTHEGYRVYHQTGEGETNPRSSYVRGFSKMATPYAAASVALYDNIDVVLMITASHNSLKWNGLKYYIKRPIPISGTVMKKVSAYALSLKSIKLAKSYTPKMIDADKVNNKYIISLVSKIVDLSVLNGKNIVLWPFLGAAPELVQVLETTGAKVILIDKNLNPPDPTRGFEESEVKRIMEENDAKISIMLDADRDRVVFIIRIAGKFYNFEPNQLYTAMHNILSIELGKNIVNVKTIPSDPGCDDSSKVNFVCGVGYKHLGILQYLSADKSVPQSQVELSVLYHFVDNKYVKLRSQQEIKDIIKKAFPHETEVIFAIWEESGGHTFNIFNIDDGQLTSDFPIIGDKYPVPAILVLCALLEMDYDFNKYIADIGRGRTTISANDQQKIQYIENLKNLIGTTLELDSFAYEVNSFSDMNNKVDVVYLQSNSSVLFVRPSGTGPNIRIYIFGPKDTYEHELATVVNYVKQNSGA